MAGLTEYGIYPLNGSTFTPGQHKTICPKCNNRRNARATPSLSIHVTSDGFAYWNCHYNKCEWSGNTGKRVLRTVVPKGISLAPGAFLDGITARGISEATALKFGVGMTSTKSFPGLGEKPAWFFPYRSPDGTQVHAVKYRSLDKDFAQEVGGEQVLFGMDLCATAYSKRLTIVEGEFDALAAYEAGVRNVVSVPGSGTKGMDWLGTCQSFLNEYDTYVIAVDNDEVGKKLKAEIGQRIGPEKCLYVEWPEGTKDLNESLLNQGATFTLSLIENAKPFPVDGVFEPSEFFEALDDFYQRGHQRGLSIGWEHFNESFTLRPKEYSVVTGYPGCGKSEWIDQIMVNSVELHDWKWGVASFENEPHEHIAKLIEKHMMGSIYRMPKMAQDSLNRGKAWVQDHFKWILMDTEEAPTMEWVLDRCMVAYRQYGLNGFVIDPWNMMAQDRGTLSETDHAAECLRRLRRFVKRTSTHVMMVCHPKVQQRNKDGKFPTPTLHDIAGGKNFHAMTDNGFTIERVDGEDAINVHVRKIRSRATGKAGGIHVLNWDNRTGRFYKDFLTEPLTTNVAANDDGGLFKAA